MDVYSEISCIKGVGAKTKELLNNCGIFNIMDLILYFPRDYKEICLNKDGVKLNNNQDVIVEGKVISISKDIRTKTGKTLTTITVEDNGEIFKCKWFNQPYMKRRFRVGEIYFFKGKLQQFNGSSNLINPSIEKNSKINDDSIEYGILPVYPLKGKLTNNILNKLISKVLGEVQIYENFPKWIIEKYGFCSLDVAIRNIHNPQDYKTLNEAKKRLKFQELFTYSLKILMLKDYVKKDNQGIAFKISKELKDLKNKIPFKLTDAQNKVIREILIDSKRSKSMNRLVQGDVGSGKTIVAIIAVFNVVKNGYQAVMMAPTEILANQHFNEIGNILKDFNLTIKLLTGSTSKKEKELIKTELRDGLVDIVVGTHALIEDDVQFCNLGIIVTDEQHRFGVMQRSKLFNKGNNVDVLVMTATPIPRTLTLYLYGDLDVSMINELPPGRQKIETYYVNKNLRDRVYNFALNEIRSGRQVYIVCPLVEENENSDLNSVESLYKKLKENYFKNVNVEIIHGKMPPKTKSEIMGKFKNNEIKVLISTTVIEVGINVPNATLMIIENAERFGLAQLHQLRGRVGRGKYKSYCVLVADIKNNKIKKRMEIMKNNSDGFYIAEEDLKIRGSGEIFGLRQHGEEGLILASVVDDIELLKEANAEAKKILKSSDTEDIEVVNYTLNKIKKSTNYICFN